MIGMQPRYAIYFAPPPTSALWELGSSWLGRDAMTGEMPPRPDVPGIPVQLADTLTIPPRQYGFHATLKAPFRPRDGVSRADIEAAAAALARRMTPFPLRLRVGELDGFLALRPRTASRELYDLAADCVREFEPFRAPLDAGELARRRQGRLSPEEDRNLAEWGYPYVFEQYRFHMTLTRRLTPDMDDILRPVLNVLFRPVLDEPVVVGSICLFHQADRSRDFWLLRHFPFARQRVAKTA